jgi:hypothetical protein
MRLFVATFILSLFLGTSVLAMDGADRQEQEQMTQKTVILQPDTDNTGLLLVALVGAVGTLGAAYITTRNRKG